MVPGIYRLPLELVRKVADESGSHDLAALALTGRHFHAWVNPYLYEHNIKHQNANAAIWAAAHGRLDTLLLLYEAENRPSKPFINKFWDGRDRYGPLLPLQRRRRHRRRRISPVKFTLLHLAAQRGRDNVVVWLLQQGADVNAPSAHMCKCYFESTIPNSWRPLHSAICHSQESTIKILLAHNASLETCEKNGFQVLHDAAASGLVSTIHHLSTLPGFDPNVKDCCGQVPLHHAVNEVEGFPAIQALLDTGANLDLGVNFGCSCTPLCDSILASNFEAAVVLLEAGAKLWAERGNDRIEARLDSGPFDTPLLHAASITNKSLATGDAEKYKMCQRKVICRLLDSGLDINHKLSPEAAGAIGETDGSTPLMVAVMHNSDPSIVRLLLERGSRCNLLDGNGWSALDHRIYDTVHWPSEQTENVKILLEHGAVLLDDRGVFISMMFEKDLSQIAEDVIVDNMGPENLEKSAVCNALELCCLLGNSRMYNAIERVTGTKLADDKLRDALEESLLDKSTDPLLDFLEEVRPELTLKGILEQWGDEMSHNLVDCLNELRYWRSSESE